jgi:IS5 family transposase
LRGNIRQGPFTASWRLLAKNNWIEAIEDEPFTDLTALDEAKVLTCRSDLFAWRRLSRQRCRRHRDDCGAKDSNQRWTPRRQPHTCLQISRFDLNWLKLYPGTITQIAAALI